MGCEGDCDDAEAGANPEAFENNEIVCDDGIDNDCDGATDLDDEDCEPFVPSGDDDDSAGDDDDDGGGRMEVGCACSATPSPASGAGLLLLGLTFIGLAARRRLKVLSP